MNVEFNNKKKNSKKGVNSKITVEESDFEGMLKARAEHLPEIEKNINKVLKDYTGAQMAIVVIVEDENGEPEGSQLLVTGTGRVSSQVALAKALHQASHETIETLMEVVKENPDMLMTLLGDVASLLKED